MPSCGNCSSSSATKRCSNCRQVWYCGKECQKANHKAHKKVCAKLAAAGWEKTDRTAAADAAARHGLEMDDEDMTKLKADFDKVCAKYDFQNDAMSSKLADFLTSKGSDKVEASTMAEKFGMTLVDANTFLMWIQIGTKFKTDVIDRNAQLAREGKV